MQIAVPCLAWLSRSSRWWEGKVPIGNKQAFISGCLPNPREPERSSEKRSVSSSGDWFSVLTEPTILLSLMRFIASLQSSCSQQPAAQLPEASCAAQRSVSGNEGSSKATATMRNKWSEKSSRWNISAATSKNTACWSRFPCVYDFLRNPPVSRLVDHTIQETTNIFCKTIIETDSHYRG